MKRLIGVFKARWFLSLIGALLLAGLIWFIGPLIAIADFRPLAGDAVRLVCVLVIMIAWGLVNLIEQIRVKSQNEALVQAVSAMPDGRPSPEEMTRAEEVAIVAERFQSALATLKQSRLGGAHGRHYLYQLPWYMLIGPPGAGKTTALINSGLKFPLEDSTGAGGVKGVGGTRNCDWWFTDEAVLIDTAGRYVTQDSQALADAAGWRAFLDQLKRYRPRQPINGVLVAISLSDLLAGSDQEREQHARTVRIRLRELQDAFGLQVPVYVLFTKADLIAGFCEFFDSLGREQRDQVWGVTFPAGKNAAASEVEAFGPEFDLLVDRLNDHMLMRVQQETDVGRRNLIVGFPTQLASLKAIAAAFLEEIFRPSRLEGRAWLRGFYFTSGTQQGTPIDRVMGAMAATFGLDAQRLSAHSGSGRSYFLGRLLREVVFQEASLVSADPRAEWRRRWTERAAYGTATLALLVMTGGWFLSYEKNEALIGQVEAAAARYNQQLDGIDMMRIADPELRRVLPPLNTLRAMPTGWDHRDDSVPLTLRLGLYQGNKLGEQALEAYHQSLDGLMLPRLLVGLKGQIRHEMDRPEPLYDALKVYLMLSSKCPLDKQLAQQWMLKDWSERYPGPANESGRTALQAHFDALVSLHLHTLPANEQLVEQARKSLEKLPLAERTYNLIKASAGAHQLPDWRVIDHGGPAAARAFARKSGRPLSEGIPGLYTYDGFYQVFLPVLDEVAGGVARDNCILRPQGETRLGARDTAKLKHDVLALYYEDFAARWDFLLSDLVIIPFKSLEHAVEVLNLLSSPNSPLRELLLAATRETTLTAPPPAQRAETAAAKAGGAIVQQKLSSTIQSGLTASGVLGSGAASGEPPLGKFIDDRFQELHRLVTDASGQPAPIEPTIAALNTLYRQLQRSTAMPNRSELQLPGGNDSAGDAILDVQTAASRSPAPMGQWLTSVAAQTKIIRLGGARAQIEQRWKSDILPVCRRALGGRYPFERGVPGDVAFTEFTRIFSPGGLIDDFFKNNLQPYVDTSGRVWRWQRVENVDLGMKPDALAQFQRAQLIRDAFFGSGSGGPLVRFELQLLDLDSSAKDVTVEIDGQTATFSHGPVHPQQLQWPGSGAGLARVGFGSEASDSPAVTGPWAWFRLLDRSDVRQSASTDRFTVRFSSGGKSASFDIRVGNVLNPFTMRELSAFRCPESF